MALLPRQAMDRDTFNTNGCSKMIMIPTGHNMFSPETHKTLQTACDWEAAKKGDKPSGVHTQKSPPFVFSTKLQFTMMMPKLKPAIAKRMDLMEYDCACDYTVSL